MGKPGDTHLTHETTDPGAVLFFYTSREKMHCAAKRTGNPMKDGIYQEQKIGGKKLRPDAVDTLDPVRNSFPAFLSHQGSVPEFEVGDLEPLSGNHVLLAYGKFLFPLAG